MGWLGLQVAKLFGQQLPAFESQTAAETELLRERDERLQRLRTLSLSSGVFSPDHTPESLKRLEKWYFELCEAEGFDRLGISRDEFERCMGTYFCEVLVHSCSEAKWVVQEFAFERGKYQLGVQKGFLTVMCTSSFHEHFKEPNDQRRQKMYRDYQKYAAQYG